MFLSSEYELLDFGAGRKLERFGSAVIDRPAPAAEGHKILRSPLWTTAHAKFESAQSSNSSATRGKWVIRDPLPSKWAVSHDKSRFELKLTDFGHVGIFPEQAPNWDWIAAACGLTGGPHPGPLPQGEEGRKPRVLNLFAYTGGSTLAALDSGVAVTHVDAARNIVGWARRNAELSGLSNAPVRWIVDDALKFAQRELRRKQHYDGMILDPPSYGHGPTGEVWKLDEHLPELLSVCRELLGSQPSFALLTCHSPDYDSARLSVCFVAAGFAQTAADVDAGELYLATADGRELHAGCFARWRQR